MPCIVEGEVTRSEPAKAGAGARILALVGAVILLFLAAVAVIAMVDIGDLTPCEDVGTDISLLNEDGECFDGSSAKKTISLVLGWPGAILACVSVLLALGFAIRGRGGRLLIKVVAAAAVLFGLSILVGSI